jgi:hypothetical protein
MILDAYDFYVLAELILGISIPDGVVYKPNAIHLSQSATQQQIDDAAIIVAGFENMVLVSDKNTIAADTIDIATITATAGAGDTQIRFDIWDSTGDHAISNEVVAVVGDVATYQFTTGLAETYKIRVYGTISFESNFIEVTAQ